MSFFKSRVEAVKLVSEYDEFTGVTLTSVENNSGEYDKMFRHDVVTRLNILESSDISLLRLDLSCLHDVWLFPQRLRMIAEDESGNKTKLFIDVSQQAPGTIRYDNNVDDSGLCEESIMVELYSHSNQGRGSITTEELRVIASAVRLKIRVEGEYDTEDVWAKEENWCAIISRYLDDTRSIDKGEANSTQEETKEEEPSDNPKLTTCPDCEGTVSRRAETCPHCGGPLTH